MAARVGKIASLPDGIRHEANQRKLDGATGREILAWLNSLPEVETRLRERFGENWRIIDQNWSDWYRGGYRDWLDSRTNLLATRELTQYAVKLAEADGGNIAAGGTAIAAGCYLRLMEAATAKTPEEQAELLSSIVPELVKLRAGDHSAEKLRHERERLAQAESALQLEREKFQRTTAELYIRWSGNEEAKRIALGGDSNETKIAALGALMFGEHFHALKDSA